MPLNTREEIETIFKQLCRCTAAFSFMIVRGKLSKEKLQEVKKIIEDSLTRLNKLTE